MNNIGISLFDNTTGNTVGITTGTNTVSEDLVYVLPDKSGKLITETETAKLITAAVDNLPEPEGIDESAVVSMFGTAPIKQALVDTDKIPVVETVDDVQVIKNVPYSDFKIELKEYFDTVYAGGSGTGTGTVTGTSAAPELSGPNTANETQTIVVTVNNYDPASIYTFDVSGGSFSRSGGVITWLLPQIVDSTAHKLTVTVTNPGKTPTSVFHPVNVFNINTTVDSMMLYEGSTMSEFATLYNISLANSKLVSTADTVLSVIDNKIATIPTMESGDKLLVDGNTYELTEILLSPDGANNTSLINAVPVASSDVTTAGTVIYESQADAAAYLAFDRNNTAGWRTNKTNGLWIGFRFNIARIINKYRIAGLTISATVAPKDWKFQASNDGITWVDLGSVSGQTAWTASELRTYTCINVTPYTHYRVYITAGNGSADIGLASLELIEAVNIVSGTIPVLPQFITSAKLLTKFAESNTITQDSYETDFTGIANLIAVYEQYNLVSATTTLTQVSTSFLNKGDIVIFGNAIDGSKSIEVSSANYVANVLDISTLGFTTVPTYGYRKDSKLQVIIGTTAIDAADRVDTVLAAPFFVSDGAVNTSTTNKVPVLTGASSLVTSSTIYAAGYEEWRAFDGLASDASGTCLFLGTTNPWISYDFTKNIFVNKYGISAKTEWATPKDWAFQGSNDGVTWNTLDTRSGVTWTDTTTTKWFTFNCDVKYRYFKLQITASSSHLGIKELIIVENNSPKIQIKAKYADIITDNYGRTLKLRVKLNQIDDAVSKISADIQKL